MDPALHEMIRAGMPGDEVAVILRLDRDVVPAGVRIVAQFGPIATARVTRRTIPMVHGSSGVRSVKAPHRYSPDWITTPSAETDDWDLRSSDERRPDSVTQTGRGIIVALVDWGLDVAHPDFRMADGSTRVLSLWDQRARPGNLSNNRYGYGWVHDQQAINAALRQSDPYSMLAYHPADASSGPTHGTHTAGIAAGNGRSGGPEGMAPESDIIFVHLATATGEHGDNIGDSAALLEAIDFISRVAGDRPWVVNLSMGKQAGPHDGRTLTELGIDAAMSVAPGRACVQSTGNYFNRPVHTEGWLRPGEVREVGFHTGHEDGFTHEIDVWYSGRDRITVEMIAPSGESAAQAVTGSHTDLVVSGQHVGRLYNRSRDPNNFDNEARVYLDAAAPRGSWRLRLTGTDVVDGRYHCWVERDPGCALCQPSIDSADLVRSSTTGTICNGLLSIAVGAYDAHHPDRVLAPFSSSGPTRDGRLKPDLVAPGVSVLSARSTARHPSADEPKLARMSGTSMAAPFVAGTIALMFQAARLPLRVRQTRELLLNAAHPLSNGEPQFRWGSGYVDVENAVAGAAELLSTQKSMLIGGVPDVPARHRSGFMESNDRTQLEAPPLILTKPACGCTHAQPGGSDSAASILQQVLDAPGAFARRLNHSQTIDGIEVLGRAGEPLRKHPIQGDIVIRIIEGGGGHASVVASPGLWLAEDIAERGLDSETESAGGHVHVEGRSDSAVRRPRRVRRVTDRAGRVLDDLVLLRLASPPPPSTVVKVEQPAAGSATIASAASGTSLSGPMGMAGDPTDPSLAAPPPVTPGASGDLQQAAGSGTAASTDDAELFFEPERQVRAVTTSAEDVGVIDSDNRVRITPTTATPWRWMCHVALEDAKGKPEGHGSGLLISDRHVLTAAHVVLDAARDPQLHFIQVRPGRDYDREPFGSWSASHVRVCPKYDPSAADGQEWDYALITLDKAVGTMKFPAIQNAALRFWGAAEFDAHYTMGPGDPRNLVAGDIYTAGYRGSKAYGTELWCSKGKVRSMATRQWPNSIYTTVDATEGQSGSPLWARGGDQLLAFGVIVDAGKTVNVARRITSAMIRELRGWIAEDGETPWMKESRDPESNAAGDEAFVGFSTTEYVTARDTEDSVDQEADAEAGGLDVIAPGLTPEMTGLAAEAAPPPLRKATAATQTDAASLPLDVKLFGELFVYKSTDEWTPVGDPIIARTFKPTRISGGDWFIPRLAIPLQLAPPGAVPEKTLIEIRVSNVIDPKQLKSQAFFWRCVANNAVGIKRLDPLGAQPGNVPSSPFLSSPSGDSPVLGPIQGSAAISPASSAKATIQATSQIQGASSVLQVQGGLNFSPGGAVKTIENLIKRVPVVGNIVDIIGLADPLTATVATQRTPQPPTYTVTFTADVLAEGTQSLTIPDHVINFDNDSAIISSKETTDFLTWAKQITKDFPNLREAIRTGMVPILVTGRASIRGNAAHNFVLSQKRVEAVRLALQGASSAAGGDRTQGGIFGSERVKIDAEADGDFHDPKPSNIDLDRLVQISIDGKAAACALDRLKEAAGSCPAQVNG